MVDQSLSEWRIHRGPYLGEVSALCFLRLPSQFSSHPLLLAGMGSEILTYNLELEKMIGSFTVFDGIRVHGLASGAMSSTQETSAIKFATKIAVYGERRVKVYSFFIDTVTGCPNKSGLRPQLTLLQMLPKFRHWVLDVCFLKGYLAHSNEESDFLAAIGCSDNSVHVWDVLKSVTVLKIQSPGKDPPIGVPEPLSVFIDTYETGKIADRDILKLVKENFDFRPGMITINLDLRRGGRRFLKTAAYGHYGRDDPDFS